MRWNSSIVVAPGVAPTRGAAQRAPFITGFLGGEGSVEGFQRRPPPSRHPWLLFLRFHALRGLFLGRGGLGRRLAWWLGGSLWRRRRRWRRWWRRIGEILLVLPQSYEVGFKRLLLL